MKPNLKSPCDRCPIIEGKHICQRVKAGKTICLEWQVFDNKRLRAEKRASNKIISTAYTALSMIRSTHKWGWYQKSALDDILKFTKGGSK